jgi:hypothetical protein
MRSSKKAVRILSALSMAVAATLAPKSAPGVTLTLYYGQDPNYSNSNNSIFISNTYNPSASATDAAGNPEFFGPAPTNVTVSQTAPTTIVMPVGDYLSLAVDAVLTGNVNPDGGKNTGTGGPTTHQVQPSFLGLQDLGLDIGFNGINPVFGTAGAPYSTGEVNVTQGPNGGAYNVAPNWNGGIGPEIVSGSRVEIGAGAILGQYGSNTAAGVQLLEQFAAANNVASYQNATDFFDSLVFQAGSTPGFATLSISSDQSGPSYWTLSTPGSSTSPSVYSQQYFGTGDVINNLPSLVIQMVEPHHPIVQQNYPADTADYGTIITSGTGDHQGTFIPPDTFSPPYSDALVYGNYEGDGYVAAQVTGINSNNGDSQGIVQVIGPGPIDVQPIRNGYTEVYGIDVDVNGTQATNAQLQTLLNAISGADGTDPSSCVASLSDPTPDQLLSSLDTATTNYNLFLTFTNDSYYSGYFSLDMSNFNDPNLVGYTFTAIAVVPEPGSAATLLLGLGLFSRRHRVKSLPV